MGGERTYVATEGRVKDDVVVHEVLINITVVAAQELRSRPLPLQRIRVRPEDITWQLVPGEEPDIDILRRPLHRIHPTLPLVEAITVAAGPTGLDAAALVTLAALANHAAAGTGVQGEGVLGLVADTLDDVDLAAVGPVGARHPEGGPDPAGGTGHVLEVEDDEAVRVLFLARHADGVAATAGTSFGGVRLDRDDAVVHTDEAGVLGRTAVDVVDVAVGWVIFLLLVSAGMDRVEVGRAYGVEGEHIKEVVATEVILDDIRSKGEWSQSSAQK